MLQKNKSGSLISGRVSGGHVKCRVPGIRGRRGHKDQRVTIHLNPEHLDHQQRQARVLGSSRCPRCPRDGLLVFDLISSSRVTIITYFYYGTLSLTLINQSPVLDIVYTASLSYEYRQGQVQIQVLFMFWYCKVNFFNFTYFGLSFFISIL